MVEAISSRRDSLFWMNIHREQLAVQQHALLRMRALVTGYSGSPDDHEADVQLVTTEIERVMDRLRYWEEVVDRVQ